MKKFAGNSFSFTLLTGKGVIRLAIIMAAPDHRVIEYLLGVLSFVLVMGIFMAYLVLRWRHVKTAGPGAAGRSLEELAADLAAKGPRLGLKRPNCWLAIRNRDLLAVQSALALHNPKPCSWLAKGWRGDGELKLYEVAAGGGLDLRWPGVAGPGEDVDVCFRFFLLELSRKVGQVQFFNSNGMLNEHAWVRADSGRILRGYAWAREDVVGPGGDDAGGIGFGHEVFWLHGDGGSGAVWGVGAGLGPTHGQGAFCWRRGGVWTRTRLTSGLMSGS